MAKITKEQIFEVAEQLANNGQNPTLAAVRNALGGGSFTTISEAMMEWRKGRTAPTSPIKEPAPQEIIDRVEILASDIWVVAREMANERLRTEREALEASRQDFERQQEEAAELADSMANEIDQLKIRLEDQENKVNFVVNENEQLGKQIQESMTNEQVLRVKYTESVRRFDDWMVTYESVKSDLIKERDNVSEGLEREKEQAVVIARLEAEKKTVEQQFQALQKQYTHDIEEARGFLVDLEQKLDAARIEASNSAVEAGKLSGEVQALRSQVAQQESLIKAFATPPSRSKVKGGKSDQDNEQ
ncbi:DNA-binding protein [Brevibacillus sp. SYSU BS000544]|uniref:DNA-binding protein n=1 Tax=Brevibacillus sp. SYSU BS000544 TaxID=3416443 RepID=UPI003CE4B5E3